MDQVKKGSKTLLDFFQASLAKKYKSDKGLDYFTPAPSTDDLKYATSSSKVGERYYFRSDEKSSGQLSSIKMTRQAKN